MAEIFRCAKCGCEVTRPVVALMDRKQMVNSDRQPFLPSGFYTVSDGKYYTGLADALIVCLADVINTKRHSNPSRLNGCCGLDGCDGPNRLCINGHEIGTEKSDCWMAHAMLLDPKAVRQELAD